MKLISMSLYGNQQMYLQGVVDNIDLLSEIYPGWMLRIYHDIGIDVKRIKDRGCETIPMPRSRDHSGMFWRFLAAWDVKFERVIFRDADSRFNIREKAAVQAWEAAGLSAHCMHDHPHHSHLPLFGGMWGIRPGILSRKLFHLTRKACKRRQARVADMRFLQSQILPAIQHSLLRHSSVRTKWPSVPFPAHAPFEGFVGQQFDNDGDPIWV